MKTAAIILLMGIIGFDLIQARTLSDTKNNDLGIINGHNVTDNAYKFMLTIYCSPAPFKTYYVCDGTIISEQYILTAASCLTMSDNADDYNGAHSMQMFRDDANTYQLKEIIKHENYNKEGGITNFNIAVAKVATNFILDNVHVKAVQLSTVLPPVMTKVQVYGWGATSKTLSSSMLQQAELSLLDKCHDYPSFVGLLCATDNSTKATAQNDEGGPMITQISEDEFVQHGIILGVIDRDPNKVISVFTNVREFYSWIQEKINN